MPGTNRNKDWSTREYAASHPNCFQPGHLGPRIPTAPCWCTAPRALQSDSNVFKRYVFFRNLYKLELLRGALPAPKLQLESSRNIRPSVSTCQMLRRAQTNPCARPSGERGGLQATSVGGCGQVGDYEASDVKKYHHPNVQSFLLQPNRKISAFFVGQLTNDLFYLFHVTTVKF